MDKTELVNKVAHLFQLSGYKVQTSVEINYREIDVVANQQQGLVRNTVIVECADYKKTVGIDKVRQDLRKLTEAKEKLGHSCVAMHVSTLGYSPKAKGYALENNLEISTVSELAARLINFENYVECIEKDKLRPIILKEYQATTMQFDRQARTKASATTFSKKWLSKHEPWLTVLGDYGVGKSWFLKKLLYELLDDFKKNPEHAPLPFFVPLQRYRKAFNFKNLILATLESYGLSGVHYDAFEYLSQSGRIIFLFDSFDEMAQSLKLSEIRENLQQLLAGVKFGSQVIMTSRPNYFEGRAERLMIVETDGDYDWHPLDHEQFEYDRGKNRILSESLSKTQYARLNDLTDEQRKALFSIVLKGKKSALKELMVLYERFKELDELSNRPVIARLLTTVAETLAMKSKDKSKEEFPIILDDLEVLNQAKIFEIVIANLLKRDVNIGSLNARDRLRFLRRFAIQLQQRNRDPFATPNEIRSTVREQLTVIISKSDTPEADLDNYYRTCRRHSGLTTEGQYLDTSGNIDLPIDSDDLESRIGFSHNSLREFLVADAIADNIIQNEEFPLLGSVIVTPLVSEFIVGLSEFRKGLKDKISGEYEVTLDTNRKNFLFSIIEGFIDKDPKEISLIGTPPNLTNLDLIGRDLSGLNLKSAKFDTSLIADTDFRKSDLRNANFKNCIFENALLDEAILDKADFSESEIESIYVNDQWNKKTTGILFDQDAVQWIFTNQGIVKNPESLNPYLGQGWYIAAREVANTIRQKIAGTHSDASLSKGTQTKYRDFAKNFVTFLMKKNILIKVTKVANTRTGKWVVKLDPNFRKDINELAKNGKICEALEPYFSKYVQERIVRK